MNQHSRRLSLAFGITAAVACLASPLLIHKAAAQSPAQTGGFQGGGFGGGGNIPYKPTPEEIQMQKDSVVLGTQTSTVSDGHGNIVVTYQSGVFAIITPEAIDAYYNSTKSPQQRRGFRLFRPHADGSIEEVSTLKEH